MKSLKKQELLRFAAKYVWWKIPEEAVAYPERVVAQVMNLGDYDDVQDLVSEVDEEYLRNVLRSADPGQFNERSWAYWHYRLGLCKSGEVPAPPQRTFA
jgi:hypothetical protein